MKAIGYAGTEGDCIVINKPTELLDWCQSRMIDNHEDMGTVNQEKCY
jgi:hypothetical protein